MDVDRHDLRAHYKRKRIEVDGRADKTRRIRARIAQLLLRHPIGIIAAYRATRGEVDLSQLFQDLPDQTWALPVTTNPGQMHFRSWQWGDPLTLGEYGIEVPQAKSPIIDPGQLGMILIPLVAFDQAGTRLGAGGGYYDRYLANLDPTTPRVGIGFNCQQAEQALPSAAWDVRLTHALTEVDAFEFSTR